jgi:hypothetical protein
VNKMLSSWKEIAHFFGKGVRTVQRWEKTLNLPIRRPPGAPSNVVLARTSDLEAWMHRGHGKAAVANEDKGVELPQTLVLLTELESEIRAVVARAGGSLPSHDEAVGDEDSVDERMKTLLTDLRSTGLASESDHSLRKAA